MLLAAFAAHSVCRLFSLIRWLSANGGALCQSVCLLCVCVCLLYTGLGLPQRGNVSKRVARLSPLNKKCKQSVCCLLIWPQIMCDSVLFFADLMFCKMHQTTRWQKNERK